MKNIENPGKLHLKGVLHELSKGAYAIPDFQREFDWAPGDVNELMRSIFEDFYIGTLLLWRATSKNVEFLDCESIYAFEGYNNFQHIVLDGQQRLSAIHYACFAPEKNFPRRKARYFFFINLEKYQEEDFENAFVYEYGRLGKALYENETLQFEKNLFPLGILGDQNFFRLSNWITSYKQHHLSKGVEGVEQKAQYVQELLGGILDNYYISVIELDREIPVDKICDIFTRINNTGVKLDIFDLLNALLRPKEINLKDRWRNQIKNFEPYLPKAEMGRLFALQTMSLLAQGVCAGKYLYYLVPGTQKLIRDKNGAFHKEVIIKDINDFDNRWDHALEKNLVAFKYCTNQTDFGAILPKLLPYPTLVPIFAALLSDIERQKYADQHGVQNKLRYWYWASVFTTNYSSSVESQMAQDLRDMRIWFADDAKVPLVVRRFKRMLRTPDVLGNTSSSSAVYKGTFILIARKRAEDFMNWNQPQYVPLDDHHIVPRSWGLKNAPDLVDSVLNRTLISEETNRKLIRDRLPNDYISEMVAESKDQEKVYSMLGRHLISKEAIEVLLRKPFTRTDFEEFLKLREQTIWDEIASLTDGLLIDPSESEVDIEVETAAEEFILNPETVLYCKTGDYLATASPGRGNRIIVKAGSLASGTIAPSFANHGYNKERTYLIETGVLRSKDGVLEFASEYEFSSPSAAAAVVLGASAVGPAKWKTAEGVTYAELLTTSSSE